MLVYVHELLWGKSTNTGFEIIAKLRLGLHSTKLIPFYCGSVPMSPAGGLDINWPCLDACTYDVLARVLCLLTPSVYCVVMECSHRQYPET